MDRESKKCIELFSLRSLTLSTPVSHIDIQCPKDHYTDNMEAEYYHTDMASNSNVNSSKRVSFVHP